MAAIIYDTGAKLDCVTLPAARGQIEVTPAVIGTRTVPAVTEERDGETVVLDPEHDEEYVVTPATYRDETAAEQAARMIAAGHMPDLPWERHVVVDTAPDGLPERWTVDWATGAVTIGGPTQADLIAAAAEKRWRVETSGFFDGAGRHIATDRDSQTKLLAEMVAIGAGLREDPSGWKLMGNGFVVLTNIEMQGVIGAARDHVQSAFAREALMQAEIAAGTVTTLAQVEDPAGAGVAPWPSNTAG